MCEHKTVYYACDCVKVRDIFPCVNAGMRQHEITRTHTWDKKLCRKHQSRLRQEEENRHQKAVRDEETRHRIAILDEESRHQQVLEEEKMAQEEERSLEWE
ncbi:hypothetical protein MMC20_000473 [Loxospora ochrophaea]|nr:hypothetical protein [Loxospora ochrophaea]